jgi:hypothetical protein
VRPRADNYPAFTAKAVVCVAITLLVRVDFRTPELRVLLWPRRVLWAAMPEATVDENGDA